jgi:hypothetical protein
MFLLYHSEGCNICEMVLHECYINDLHTTTCSCMLGHHSVLVGTRAAKSVAFAPASPALAIVPRRS